MTRFINLSQTDKIQNIKDIYILMLEKLAANPSKLSEYIKLTPPKHKTAKLETIKDTATDAEKELISKRNNELLCKVELENKKLSEDFEKNKEICKNIENFLSKVKKKEGCICGSCININVMNNAIPPELEPLLEIARREAEERDY